MLTAENIAAINQAYDAMDIPRGTPFSEVKKVYRKFMIETHPDKNGGRQDPRVSTYTNAYGKLEDLIKEKEQFEYYKNLTSSSIAWIAGNTIVCDDVIRNILNYKFSQNGQEYEMKLTDANVEYYSPTLADEMVSVFEQFAQLQQRFPNTQPTVIAQQMSLHHVINANNYTEQELLMLLGLITRGQITLPYPLRYQNPNNVSDAHRFLTQTVNLENMNQYSKLYAEAELKHYAYYRKVSERLVDAMAVSFIAGSFVSLAMDFVSYTMINTVLAISCTLMFVIPAILGACYLLNNWMSLHYSDQVIGNSLQYIRDYFFVGLYTADPNVDTTKVDGYLHTLKQQPAGHIHLTPAKELQAASLGYLESTSYFAYSLWSDVTPYTASKQPAEPETHLMLTNVASAG